MSTDNDMFQPLRALTNHYPSCSLTGKTLDLKAKKPHAYRSSGCKTYHPKAATKKPKPASAKPKEKKRKPVSESLEVPPLAKRAKAGKVVKKRTVKSSKQLVDENSRFLKVSRARQSEFSLSPRITRASTPLVHWYRIFTKGQN
ncbi:hypothetical protein Tco_1360596 [Tanacetum coccineum]